MSDEAELDAACDELIAAHDRLAEWAAEHATVAELRAMAGAINGLIDGHQGSASMDQGSAAAPVPVRRKRGRPPKLREPDDLEVCPEPDTDDLDDLDDDGDLIDPEDVDLDDADEDEQLTGHGG